MSVLLFPQAHQKTNWVQLLYSGSVEHSVLIVLTPLAYIFFNHLKKRHFYDRDLDKWLLLDQGVPFSTLRAEDFIKLEWGLVIVQFYWI